MQTRVFVVHALPELASRFFKKVDETGMMEDGYVWIITEGLTSRLHYLDHKDESMQGVLGVMSYIPKDSKMDFDDIGTLETETSLLPLIRNFRFDGLTGDFNVINGTLQASVYQIVNVIGNGEKPIGFWSPKNGITKKLNDQTNGLKPVTWPGDTHVIPKGWRTPVRNKNRLRIGVQ
ncbi:hypothetical protein E3N88_43031 [Mikania micrantha]|uniref:Receptor ligand binding region domain-containing protein n=1 Tax=Mikania micrantha TaxID=192012 RepID=A0A5N6LG72_9ASTR|nr:hypothetical protein E3N88_43031 [Mikania micrantha]